MAQLRLDRIRVDFLQFYAADRSLKRRLLGGLQTGSRRSSLRALDDVTLSLTSGTRLALLGGNASGKTTLLRVMAGLLKPSRGQAEITGRAVGLFGTGIGIGPSYTVEQTIIGHGLLMGFPLTECRRRLPKALTFGALENVAELPLNTLGQGEQIRVGLSIAPAYDADILLVDEMTEHLSPAFVEQFLNYIHTGMPEGSIVVIVERSRSLLQRACNQAALLREGRLVETGPLADMLARHGNLTTF
jgi:lipopolysaccharide transport system ATP-binding protein